MTQILVPFMDLQLVDRSLKFWRRKKKWMIWLALVGASGYGACRVYNSPSVTRKRRRLVKLIGALASISELVADSVEAARVVAKNVREFLESDSDEIPSSFRQISKIAKSDEFSESLSRVTEALTRGILRGYEGEKKESAAMDGVDFTDRVMDKLFTPMGTGFVSAVLGSFTRNLVLGFYANGLTADGERGSDTPVSSRDGSDSSNERWLSLLCSDKSRDLIADCIQSFVSTAVTVYLDKTMHINFYDELFSGLTDPRHKVKIRNILVSLCNGAVETLVKTSHQVLTCPSSSSERLGSNSPQQVGNPVLASKFFQEEVLSKQQADRGLSHGIRRSEWFGQAMSTLSVPRNRRFVLDLTGRVTFETIRSFLAFVLWKLSDSTKKCVNVVQEEVLDKGHQIVGFVSAKYCVIVTICLAVYLHLYGYSRTLLPA
ncbi:hypothetical protein MLD38_034503 [Melastoma candidum]|uniref:Uncharacterized protein n=1 Tax=Melastoma candidum TaxID=119954 RepID=A0ACB9MA52_9MYRT|nr:hypothetical protein MLD38_034503 [Melastoma candidum]